MKCTECQFEGGEHSFECSKYVDKFETKEVKEEKWCECNNSLPHKHKPNGLLEVKSNKNIEGWEEQPEVLKWIEQGRDKEHIYAVKNFLTGQGAVMIERLLQVQRAELKAEIMTLIYREIAIAHTKDKGGKTSRLTSLAMKISELLKT